MESVLKDPKLIVELVPRTCFFSNLRSNLSKKDWDKLRHLTIDKANHHCEICGSTGNGSSLECHEIWKYDDDNNKQTLTGLIALCKACHRSKHMALARHKGWEGVAEDHLMRINDWNRQTLDVYLEEVFLIFERRSTQNWSLDISWLEGFEVDIPVILDRDTD
jgi:hypothetical protein